jgi:predicted RNA-binding Zn ribbon-like protein
VQSSKTTGQWFRSGDGHQWWFDSGALSLDFAYSGAMGDNPAWEDLHSAEDLSVWLEGRFPDQLTAASPAADDVDVINLFAATPDIPPALAGGSRQAGRAKARPGQALSAMAREAVELFTPEQRERIRLCAADDCGLVFYDESRSNNRRWCSMKRCGNRAKVRTHRALNGA